MLRQIGFILIILAITTSAIAQSNGPSDKDSKKNKKGSDLLPWSALSDVKFTKQSGKYIVTFGEELQKLDGKTIKLDGFIMPLEQAPKQKNFILTKMPFSSCFFCGEEDATSLVEIRAVEAVEFGYTPIIMQGKLELLKDDPMGMFYRIVDAKQVGE